MASSDFMSGIAGQVHLAFVKSSPSKFVIKYKSPIEAGIQTKLA